MNKVAITPSVLSVVFAIVAYAHKPRLYRSLKTKVYNVGVRGREFTETKYIFLKLDGRRWANGDWGELEILLKVTRARCHLCGRRLTAKDVGYVRVGNGVEFALCEACLRDYLEWRGVEP